MEERGCNSLSKANFLSLAQNITKSKLINRNFLRNGNSNLPKNNSKLQTSSSSSLLYSNITHNKERSRSVNAMMNNLLKQAFIIKEQKPQKDSQQINNIQSYNLKQKKNFDLSVSYSSQDNEENEIEITENDRKMYMTNRISFYKNSDTISTTTELNNLTYGNVEEDEKNKYDNYKPSVTSRYATPCTYLGMKEYSSLLESYNSNTFHASSHQTLNKEIMPSTQNTNCNNSVLQLEDLIVLEEKLFHILDSFRFGKPGPKLCMEWWSFYTYSSFSSQFECQFPLNTANRQICHESVVLELLTVILIYEVLKDPKIAQSTLNILKSLINEIHQNFLIMIDLILTKISSQSLTNIWINKMQNIVLSKRAHRIYKNEHLNLLKKNNAYIQTIIRNIMRIYSLNKKVDISTLNFYFKKITKTTIKTLNDYFKKIITFDCSKKGETLTFVISEKSTMPSISYPYLPKKTLKDRNKAFTLVLDLDETLICFKINEKGKGMIRFRPGLDQFLQELSNLYEMIIFTAGTQDYADPILNEIENEEKYFSKRLYRQHSVIIDNTIVKDLSKLGRDLSKVIIIDNMPQNFRLQKENGIFIKNFYGDDHNDTALLDLIPILKEIASDPQNDVRVKLKALKNEIFTKITTNLDEETQ